MKDSVPTQMILQNKLQGRIFDNWSTADKVMATISIGITLFAALTLGKLVNSSVGILVFLIFAVCSCFLLLRAKKGYGRIYRELWIGRKSLMMRTKKKGIWWQAEETESPEYGAPRRKGLMKQRNVIPLSTDIIDTLDLDGVRVRFALTHHLDKPYDQLYIKCTGGDIANQDPVIQNACVQELANIINRTLRMSELKVGVAYLRVTAPANEYPYIQYLLNNGSPAVFAKDQFQLSPEQTQVSDWLYRYNNQIIPAARNFGVADEWSLVVLTIRRRNEWKRAAKGKLNSEELYNLPVLRLGRNLVRDLQTSSLLNFGDVHILKPEELFLLNRVSWDISGLEAFYAKYSSIVVRNKGDETAMYKALTRELSCWPERIIESPEDNCIRMDDNWISVVRTTQLPEQIRADRYLGLQTLTRQPDVWIRSYSGGEAISGNHETNQLMLKEAAVTNAYNALYQNRIVHDPRVQRKKRELSQQADIVSAASIAQFSNEFRAVVAPSKVLLRLARERLIADLGANGFEAEVVSPLALQLDAVLTATLGASRL